MNKLIVESYFADFEDYDMLLAALEPLYDKGIGVELHIFDDAEFNARLLSQKDRFAKYYMAFHGPHRGVEVASAKGSEIRRRAIDAWTRAFSIYGEFNAKSIVLHTNQLSFRPQEKALLQEQSIDTMNEILDLGKEAGADVLVENVGWVNTDSMLFGEDEFIALFDRLRPWADCLIDVGHAFINRWDMEKVISALKHKIKAYHLHNNDGVVDSHRPMFERGLFYSEDDTAKLLQIMEKYTPGADWILEYAPSENVTPQLVVEECNKFYSMNDGGAL